MFKSQTQRSSWTRIAMTLVGATVILMLTTSDSLAQRGRGDGDRGGSSFGGGDRGGSPFGGEFGGSPFGGRDRGGSPFGGGDRGGSPFGGAPAFGGSDRGRSSSGGDRSRDAAKVEKQPRPRVTIDLPAQYVAQDTDRDGQLGLYEWSRGNLAEFRRLDRNSDGFLTPRELAAQPATRPAAIGSPSVAVR
jgi:hypothetical protein